MTDDLCPREADVLRACEAGEMPDALRMHLATCDSCREVETVTRALLVAVEAETEAEAAAPLAGASHIWWRAQWEARQEAAARAMRPLDTVERAEPLIALVAIATLLVMRGETIASRVLSWLTSEATSHTLQAVMPPALLPLLIIGASLGGVVLIVGLGAVMAND